MSPLFWNFYFGLLSLFLCSQDNVAWIKNLVTYIGKKSELYVGKMFGDGRIIFLQR